MWKTLGKIGESVFPAVAGGLSQLFGARARRKEARKEREHNLQLAEYSYSKDLEMWQRQNEYNTPKAQMERYKDAGLNQHLIYGQGTPGNVQSSTPQYQAPKMEYDYTPYIDPLSMLQSYQDFKQKGETINLTNRQVKTEMFRSWVQQSQATKLVKENDILGIEEQYLQETFDDRTAYQTARKIYQELTNTLTSKYVEWAKDGMNPRDATWVRMTMELLRTLGISSEQLDKLKIPKIRK